MKKFVLITFLGALIVGCDSDELDFDNVKVQPITGDYGFPLGEVTYTMRELIDQQQDGELSLQEDSSTSLLFLLYQESFDYDVQNDFVDVGDINNSRPVNLASNATPAPPITTPGTITIATPFTNLTYEPQGGEEIDSLFHSGGEINVTVRGDLQGDLSYTLTFNNTVDIDTESPLVIVGQYSNPRLDTEPPVTVSADATPALLDGNKTILPDVQNEFSIDLSASLTLGAGQTFAGTETLEFDITYANQTFSLIYGKFGRDTVQVGNQTLDIDFFEDSGNGIFFGNPTITFNINNSFGIPIGMDFSTMFSDNGAGSAQTFLSGDITDDLPDINPGTVATFPPTVTINQTNTITEINSGNSNIVDLFSTSPTRFGFDVTAISNPTELNVSNFVAPGSSELDATIDVLIPMEIRLEDFEQTGSLSLGTGLDVTSVDSAFIRVVTVNELPFSGVLALEIQDADSNTLHTVTDNLVLNAPFINIDGFVTDPNGISADVPLNATGIDALSKGSHILLTLTLNTPSSLNSRDIFVKVLADYRLQIKIGIGGTLKIDL